MARKWQKVAASGRKRVSFSGLQKRNSRRKAEAVAEKGHFVAYAADSKRYMLPLTYLQSPVFQELSKMAEEERGFNINGAITLPCDSQFMVYTISTLQEDMPKEMESASLLSLSNSRCLSFSDFPRIHPCQHLPLHVF